MAWPSLSPIELLFSVPCILLFLYYYHHFTSKNKPSNVIPVYFPVVGMMPSLIFNLPNFHAWITKILQVSGCNFLFHGAWFSGMKILVTCDPLNIQHVFTSNFQNYPKGDEFLEIFDILGDGIFNADADKWRSQRVKAQQLISHSRFRAYVAQLSQEKVEKTVLPFLDHAAEQGRAIDLQDVSSVDF